MASTQLGAAIRQVQDLFRFGTVSEVPDDHLLERFRTGGDATAFEELVRRHGPMVLSVCRGVLRNAEDVPDAFQATFLVLLRKASSIRTGVSLAGWLYRVAFNMATQMNSDAARRREVERQAGALANIQAGGAAEDEDETSPVVYEEVNRLPEKLRLPVVLCHLEEMTHAQAAQQLGWTVGTVRGRVARARDLLRQRLARRGLALSAGALATALTEHSAKAESVPNSWVAAVVEATKASASGPIAAGAVSATAVASCERMLRAMAVAKLRWAALVGLAAGGSTFLAITLVSQTMRDENDGRREPPARLALADAGKAAKPAAPRADDDATPVPIAGRVVDPLNRPVAGATLYVQHSHWGGSADQAYRHEQVAVSGPDGQFRFDLDPSKSNVARDDGPAWHEAIVVATATGFGPAWLRAVDGSKGDATLRLAPDDVPVRGRILDTEGRPAAGAIVRVERLAEIRDADPGPLLTSGRLDWDDFIVTGRFRGPVLGGVTWLGQNGTAKTDANGRFELTGLGRDRLALLRVEGQGLEYARLAVLDRPSQAPAKGGRPSSPTPDPLYGEITLPLYGATFERVVGPSKPIQGFVRVKETGEPVAGVTVAGQAARKVWSVRMTTTDARGHFRLDGLPKSESYRVDVRPVPGSPYLNGSTQTLSDTENLRPIEATFELPRGVVVQGRVTDPSSDQVLPCEWVQYFPMAGNPHRGNIHGMAFAPDHAFRLTVPSGRGIVVVKLRAKPNRYPEAELTPADRATLSEKGRGGLPPVVSLSLNNAYRLVDIPEGSGPVTIDMTVTPTPVVEGELIFPGGKLTSGVKAMGLTIDPFPSATITGPHFEVLGMRPGQERFVEFRQEALGLAGAATVKSPRPAAEPLTVTLVKCGTLAGRLLADDGVPLRGTKLSASRPSRYGPSDPLFRPREATTDADGRFRIEEINPATPVDLWIEDPNHPRPAFEPKPDRAINQLTVPSGDVLDLGDVHVEFRRTG